MGQVYYTIPAEYGRTDGCHHPPKNYSNDAERAQRDVAPCLPKAGVPDTCLRIVR